MLARHLFACLLLASTSLVHAEGDNEDLPEEALHLHPEDEHDAWTASVWFENDLFANTDSNYTNGVKLSLSSPDVTQFKDANRFEPWIGLWVDRLPFIDQGANEDSLRSVTVSIGQKIFTPDDTQATQLIEDDRPYAGWLYIGTAFHTKTSTRLDTIELNLGMVGPASLAENSQNFIHELRDIPSAKGWDNQLDNEPAFALVYEQKRRFRPRNLYGRFGYDLIGHVGASLGTVQTYASLGMEARLGWNIPADFGTSLIRPGGDTNAPVDSSDPRISDPEGFSAHLFVATAGRYVVRDIFLDGNTFSSSHSVDKKNTVGDLIYGVSFIYQGFKLSYAQVVRTREFELQESSHRFGSISLSFSF